MVAPHPRRAYLHGKSTSSATLSIAKLSGCQRARQVGQWVNPRRHSLQARWPLWHCVVEAEVVKSTPDTQGTRQVLLDFVLSESHFCGGERTSTSVLVHTRSVNRRRQGPRARAATATASASVSGPARDSGSPLAGEAPTQGQAPTNGRRGSQAARPPAAALSAFSSCAAPKLARSANTLCTLAATSRKRGPVPEAPRGQQESFERNRSC